MLVWSAAALFCISAQPGPSMFGWLFIAHLLLVVNGEPGQFALHHQRFRWLPCFCFPAASHFNDRCSRVTCSKSRASTATSAASTECGTFNNHPSSCCLTTSSPSDFLRPFPHSLVPPPLLRPPLLLLHSAAQHHHYLLCCGSPALGT